MMKKIIKKVKKFFKTIDNQMEESYKDYPPEQLVDDVFGFNRNI